MKITIAILGLSVFWLIVARLLGESLFVAGCVGIGTGIFAFLAFSLVTVGGSKR